MYDSYRKQLLLCSYRYWILETEMWAVGLYVNSYFNWLDQIYWASEPLHNIPIIAGKKEYKVMHIVFSPMYVDSK